MQNAVSRNSIVANPRSPIIVAAFGSLLLSWIAVYFNPVLSRDSALYVDVAQTFAESGFSAALGRFDWPWVSILIGAVQRLTGAGFIASAHLVTAALMACLCALLVRTAWRLNNAAAWWACLMVLTVPAFNSYRDDVLREPGFWLFSALTMYCSIRWHQSRRFRYMGLAVASVLGAMLFRLEAIFLFGPIAVATLYPYRKHLLDRWKQLLIGSGLLFAAAAALVLVLGPSAAASARVIFYLSLLDPSRLIETFRLTSELLAENVLDPLSKDHASVILFSGFLSVVLLTTGALLGPFFPVLLRKNSYDAWISIKPAAPFLLSSVGLYIGVLMVFFMQNNFMINRYVALIHVITAPPLAIMTYHFACHYRKTACIGVVIAMIAGLVNVISLSPKRLHYLDAASWISESIPSNAKVFYEDPRIAFYAKRGYLLSPSEREAVLAGEYQDYDFLVLDTSQNDHDLTRLIEDGPVEPVKVFTNKDGRKVAIIQVRTPREES